MCKLSLCILQFKISLCIFISKLSLCIFMPKSYLCISLPVISMQFHVDSIFAHFHAQCAFEYFPAQSLSKNQCPSWCSSTAVFSSTKHTLHYYCILQTAVTFNMVKVFQLPRHFWLLWFSFLLSVDLAEYHQYFLLINHIIFKPHFF